MASLAIGQTTDCANPVLDLFTQVNGVLTNVAQLQFQIFDRTGDSPVQIYPSTPGDRATLDVDDDCPAGARLDTGHYVAMWTVPGGTTPGTYGITWFFKLTLSTGEQTYSEEFEILPEVSASTVDGYTFVSEMRDEGVTTAMASDMRLERLINMSTTLIDQVTGLFFKPRALTIQLDAPGTQTLFMQIPIIGISAIQMIDPVDSTVLYNVPLTDVVIYNRHLSQRLLNPDDRRNPRIVRKTGGWFDGLINASGYPLRSGRVWREGFQNMQITGVFGYTEPVYGSPNQQGQVPINVNQACKMLVVRELELLTSPNRIASRRMNEIRNEATRDQSVAYADRTILNRLVPPYGTTGDPEVDALLAMYRPPMKLGTTFGSCGRR